jgi:mRNA interferase MazF
MYVTGDILLIPFPFTEHTGAKKVRPSVVVCETADAYRDIVVCAISSVVPANQNPNEILLQPDPSNNLRRVSVLKTDRIVTVKAKDVIAQLGKLNVADLATFKAKFRALM